MRPNVYGPILAEQWVKTASSREYAILDEWVVMPNHFHGIVIVGAQRAAPLQ